MSKITKQINFDLEEFLVTTSNLSLHEDKSNFAFIEYRSSLFKIAFFNVMKNKVRELKNNLLFDPEMMKNVLVLYNKLVTDINYSLYDLQFQSFNLELTRPETRTILIKKNPFKSLLERIQHPSSLEMSDLNRSCIPINGLLSFIIYHKTKTRNELSINVISDTKTSKNENQLKDVTDVIDSKNPYLLRELDSIDLSFLKDKMIPMINKLAPGKPLEEVEGDLFYGFFCSLTLNKNGIDDVHDVFDMLYHTDKTHTPYLQLYCAIFQYKKETKHFAYDDLEELDLKNYNHVFKGVKQSCNENLINSPLFFFHEKESMIKLFAPMKVIIAPKQEILFELNEQHKLPFTILIQNKSFRLYLTPNEILYNNILPLSPFLIFNQTRLYSTFVLYDKHEIDSNPFFNLIDDHFILTNNEILFHKDEDISDNKIYILFKINSSHMPWGKLITFIRSKPELNSISFKTPEDVVHLLNEFKKEDEVNGIRIINMLIFRSLSLTFLDIYPSHRRDRSLQDFQSFYSSCYEIQNCRLVQKKRDEIRIGLYSDFIFVFEIILLLIKKQQRDAPQ